MEIENFKLIDFFNQKPELIEEYIRVLRYIKPLETERKVFEMKLRHVEAIKRTVNSGNEADLIYIVSKVQKISEEDVFEMKIIEFFGILHSIRNQTEVINKAEENGLSSSELDIRWLAVNGSERMSKYGIYNTLDRLTKKKPHLYKKYMNMIYSEIFTILLKWKEEEDLQKEMNAIKTKKEDV